ncbi:MAG: DNA gyrase inhibitor YacG [Enterobacteriaceae bacterium]
MTNSPLIIACPQCRQSVTWDSRNPFRPFCSKRCQLIDLGEWADEEKRIPADEETSEEEVWSETF